MKTRMCRERLYSLQKHMFMNQNLTTKGTMTTKTKSTTKKQTRKPDPVGTCGHCGADMYDAQPMTCCVPGLVGYLEAVIENATELQRSSSK